MTSTDSVSHSVKIYSDILAGKDSKSALTTTRVLTGSSDWISGNDSLPVTAAASIENDIIMLSTQLQTPIPFASLGGRANDATAYYAIKTARHSIPKRLNEQHVHLRVFRRMLPTLHIRSTRTSGALQSIPPAS